MSLSDVTKMSDLTKMMLFMFLGLVIAILVLGFHKSPQASPTLGAREARSAPSPNLMVSRETYPPSEIPY